MEPGSRFSPALKKKVWKEQGGLCGICGSVCRGHGVRRPSSVHHINPRAWGGPGTRVNAIGLCQPCHDEADRKAFQEGKLINEN